MDLKAILEVSVLLDKFVNIDLIEQGLYQLKISCFYAKNSKINAQPISFEPYSRPKKKINLHNIIPGSIDEDTFSIKSKIFFIRYAEEKVKIAEQASFYIELHKASSYESHPLLIQIDLLHAEVSKKNIIDNYKTFSYEESLKVVGSKRYEITAPLKGLVEYFPINFKSNYFCAVDSILLVVFYDYKVPSSDIGILSRILFADKKHKAKSFIGGEEIDRKYSEYVSVLAQVHDNLRKAIESISYNCFIEDVEIPRPIQLPVSLDLSDHNKSFAENLSTHEPFETSKELINEIKCIAGYIYEELNLIKTMIAAKPRKICKYLKKVYQQKIMMKYGEFIIKELNKKWDIDICHVQNTKKMHKNYANYMRNNEYYKNVDSLSLQEENQFQKINNQAIIFEEVHHTEDAERITEPSYNYSLSYALGCSITIEPDKLKSKHLIVLVHGFQGSSFDLRNLHNFIKLAYPHCEIFESSHNENKTEGDIKEMGARLSKELISYLTEFYPMKAPSISFIGHSLGGLIIRAALPYLECISDKMHLYMSLSTPHLGFMYSTKILDAGMWLLKKFKKILSLSQLCLEDSAKPEGSFLYALSKANGLEWFNYVVLVSSLQDDYAPFDSARIEVPKKASKDPEMGNCYIQMAHNLLQKLSKHNLIKLDVQFKLAKSIDSIIGRSAHIQMVENQNFLQMLVYRYPEFFA